MKVTPVLVTPHFASLSRLAALASMKVRRCGEGRGGSVKEQHPSASATGARGHDDGRKPKDCHSVLMGKQGHFFCLRMDASPDLSVCARSQRWASERSLQPIA